MSDTKIEVLRDKIKRLIEKHKPELDLIKEDIKELLTVEETGESTEQK